MDEQPDEHVARDPVQFVIFGLASLVLWALAIAAIALPPWFAVAYFQKGRHGIAAALGVPWLGVMLYLGSRLMRARGRLEDG